MNKLKELNIKLIKTGFLHIFGSGIINQIVSFISWIILIRILTKSEYGIFSYVNNILSFFLLLSGIGLVSGIMQICSENYNSPNKALSVFRYGSKIALRVNIILCLFIVLTAIFVPFELEGANFLLLLMSITPMLTISFELIQIYFRYNRLNKHYSYYTTFNTAAVLFFSVIGAIIGELYGFILLKYFGYIATIFLGVIFLKFPINTIKCASELQKTDKLDLLKLSLISMANNGTGQLIFILDIFIIGLLIPNETVIASYKVATIIPNALIFIPGALMVYLYPYFAGHKDDKTWVRMKFNLIIKYFGLFNLLLIGVLMVSAPVIIKLLFGNQYLDAVLPFRILLISYFFSSTFRKVVGNLLVTQRKLKFNFYLGIFEGVINIIFNIIFITQLGSVGAAISSLLVAIVSSIIGVYYFKRVV